MRRRSPSAPPPVRSTASSSSLCAPPGLLWPRLVAPPRAAAARRRRARACARATPWPRPCRDQGQPLLDPAWWAADRGPRLSAAGLAGCGWPQRFQVFFFVQQYCKMCRNLCITPKIMKLVLLDSSSLDLLKKNIFCKLLCCRFIYSFILQK